MRANVYGRRAASLEPLLESAAIERPGGVRPGESVNGGPGGNDSAGDSPNRGPGRPIRVLHVVDLLGSGGTERWIYDIIRRSDPAEFEHRIITVYPCKRKNVDESSIDAYGERLRKIGAYAEVPEEEVARKGSPAARAAVKVRRAARELAASPFRGLPLGIKHRLYRVHLAFWLVPFHVQACARIVREFRSFRPDVLMAHLHRGLNYSLLLKLLFRAPIVYLLPCSVPIMKRCGWGWMTGVFRRFHRLVDVFFCAREFKPELAAEGVPAGKIVGATGVVDIEAAAEALSEREQYRESVRERLGIPAGAPVLLSVGRFTDEKGHQHTVEALPAILRAHPDAHWVALGDGWKQPEIAERVRELGLEERAHLAGFVTEPLPFYAAADVYLRTNIWEADNLSSYQAMAMGLPVAGFDSGCATELLPKVGHGIQVPNHDEPALAEAVIRILNDPAAAQEMGARGRRYACEHLDVRSTLDHFLSVYRALAARAPVARLDEERDAECAPAV